MFFRGEGGGGMLSENLRGEIQLRKITLHVAPPSLGPQKLCVNKTTSCILSISCVMYFNHRQKKYPKTIETETIRNFTTPIRLYNLYFVRTWSKMYIP